MKIPKKSFSENEKYHFPNMLKIDQNLESQYQFQLCVDL